MASSSTNEAPWFPEPGRHSVKVGGSLMRALKVRKGEAPAPPKRIPDRDFYSLMYKFKPSSLDTTKSGTLQTVNDGEVPSVTVEQPSTQAGETHVFKGHEMSAKDWMCVLIYDEETNTYTLEKVDSQIIVGQSEKKAVSGEATARPSTSKSKPSKLESGEVDMDTKKSIPSTSARAQPTSVRPAAAVVDEVEEDKSPLKHKAKAVAALATKIIPPKPAKQKKMIQRPAPPTTATRPPGLPAKPQTAAPPPVPKAEPKRPVVDEERPTKRQKVTPEVEEELLDWGRPAVVTPPASVPKQQPLPAKPAFSLELPGPSTVSVLPSSRLAATPVAPPAVSSAPTPIAVESDSEESDWDEVTTAPAHTEMPEVPFAEDADDFDEDMFTTMLEEELEIGDDLDNISSEAPPVAGQPISWKEMADQEPVLDFDDIDDETSSDESEDD